MSFLVQRMLHEQKTLCKIGDEFPRCELVRYSRDNKPEVFTSTHSFRGRVVVVFGVPGAFTPTCSKVHLAGFSALAEQFKESAIDVYCHAPDSVDAMQAWLERDDKSRYIQAFADPEGQLTSLLGIGMDKHARGLGYVPKRYAMVLEQDAHSRQYCIKHLAVEDDAAICGATSAESIHKVAKSFSQHIEHLTPPVLTDATIDEKIACTRPMREGKFNISVEEKEGKVLVHCVGHGGAGCTTLWGSVGRAISLFEAQYKGKQSEPLHVVGTGIIGLTTAIELSRKGYNVSQITTREFFDIPSWKNAGYFALVSVDSDPEEQANMAAISMASYLEYKKIHEGDHPYISKECIRYMPVYCSKDTEAGVENLEEQGLIPKRENVTIDFGNGVQHEGFVKFMTYFMDTTRIMLELRQEVDRLGIKIVHREINSFNELPESIVFDCTGLGSKLLNGDDKMIAVRGHLANLNVASGQGHMDYMIYTKVKEADGGSAYVYMFPKCLQVTKDTPKGREVAGTLGGTFIPNADNLTEEQLRVLDAQEFKKLLDRNSQFFYGKVFG